MQAPKELVPGTREACNKGNICVAKTSPPDVHKAYLEQFQTDFSLFLRCRAQEMVPGGHMLLINNHGQHQEQRSPFCIWEFVGLKLNEIVSEVRIKLLIFLSSLNFLSILITTSYVADLILITGLD